MNTESFVFISYRNTDKDIAYETKNILMHNGINIWMAPESIPAGSDYGSEIPKALESCSAFVIILSEDAQNSKWIPKEIDGAINNGKIIIPFKIDDCIILKPFDFRLGNSQRIEAYQRMSDAYLELINRLKEILHINNREIFSIDKLYIGCSSPSDTTDRQNKLNTVYKSLTTDDEYATFESIQYNHLQINRQRIDCCYSFIDKMCQAKNINLFKDGLKTVLIHNDKQIELAFLLNTNNFGSKIYERIKLTKYDGIYFICLGEKNDKNIKKIRNYTTHTITNNKIVKWYLLEDFINDLFGCEALEELKYFEKYFYN